MVLRLTAASAVVAGVLAIAPVPGGAATACAQVPELPIPTIGPLDPTCSRVPDTDTDEVLDVEDNCHGYYNPSQADTDGDSGEPPYEPVPLTPRDPQTGGDACDVDDDADGIADVADNCPKSANAGQADLDRDGIGDACDPQTTPPAAAAVARIRLGAMPRRVRVSELRAGLAVPVRCTAACRLTADLRRGSRVLGRGTARVAGPASTFVFVRLAPATLRRLRRGTLATLRVRAGRAVVSRRLRISA